MYPTIRRPTPTATLDTYTVSTPFGTVTIANGGRSVYFELYSDIRQSRHNTALFRYIQHLIDAGVTQFNVDHIPIGGRDRRLSLDRGNNKLDLVYIQDGKTYECELKTSREIGLEVTARQLQELVKHCENLIILVPRGCTEDMSIILNMINLSQYVTVRAYDDVDDAE
jgi:hypothetical protein